MRYLLNLQLFATSKTSSSSSSKSQTQSQESSQSNTHTEGGSTTTSSSSTVGGSHSESNGWAESDSTGYSQSQSASQGGSHSNSSGKSWASGEVDANTQAKRNQYSQDYQQGQKAQDAYDRLQNTLDQKPQFQSQYESKLNDLYNSIMNREKFTYDFNADQMYQMYKDKYTTAGKKAMEDTMAQNAALSGGYGSSYSQTAGQQTYQNYLQQLNDMLPTLRNQAYSEYQDEGNRMLEQYNLTNDAYNREYGQYRDNVSDWQNDRSFEQSNYQDERNFDYNQYNNERNFWNQEYWNERNAEQSNSSSSDATNWNKGVTETNSKEHTSQKNGSTTDTSSWSNTNSVSNTSSWQDSTTNSLSNSLVNSWSTNNSSSTTVNDSMTQNDYLNLLYGNQIPSVDKNSNTGYSNASGWYDSETNRINQALSQPGVNLTNIADYNQAEGQKFFNQMGYGDKEIERLVMDYKEDPVSFAENFSREWGANEAVIKYIRSLAYNR